MNNAKDPGGATNQGVTQNTYDGYRRGKGLLPRSVKFITADEVSDCYKHLYWDKVCGDQLPKGIDFCTFDAAVNSGVSRAEKWLQQAINKVAGTRRLVEDGNIGFATIDAADDYPAERIIDASLDVRLGFMKVARHSKTKALLFPTFGAGWQNRLFGYLPKGAKVRRADGVDDEAKRMAAEAASSAAVAFTASVVKPDAVVPFNKKPPLPPSAPVQASVGTGSKAVAAIVAIGLALVASGADKWLN